MRKVSVFCLVAVQASVGDTIKEYLTKLSSSQVSQVHCTLLISHTAVYRVVPLLLIVWCAQLELPLLMQQH